MVLFVSCQTCICRRLPGLRLTGVFAEDLPETSSRWRGFRGQTKYGLAAKKCGPFTRFSWWKYVEDRLLKDGKKDSPSGADEMSLLLSLFGEGWGPGGRVYRMAMSAPWLGQVDTQILLTDSVRCPRGAKFASGRQLRSGATKGGEKDILVLIVFMIFHDSSSGESQVRFLGSRSSVTYVYIMMH